MMKQIDKYSAPYLQLLTVRTALSVSPIMKKMQSQALLCEKDFCIRISASDVNYSGLAKIWKDLDTRWPLLAEGFASQVDIVDETFLRAVQGFYEANAEDYAEKCEFFAKKTFSGTIIIQPMGYTLSYSLSFDCLGDIASRGSSILLLDASGTIMAFVTPDVEYVNREIRDKATGHLHYVMPPLDIMMGANQMKELVRRYLLYRQFGDVDIKPVARPGTLGTGGHADDAEAYVNYYSVEIQYLISLR